MGESLFVLKYISIGAAIALLIWIIGFVLYKWLIAPCFYGGRKEWRRTTVSAYYLSNSDDLRYSQLLVAESFGTGRRTPSPSSSLSRARPLSSLSFSHYEESESSRSNRAFTAELGKPPVLPPWDSAPSYVVPGNWFEFVTGVTEYGFAGSKGNIVVPYYDLAGSDGGDIDPKAEIYQRWRDAPYLGIKNVADGRLYRAGMFYTASVKELNKSVCEIAEKVPHMRKNACKFIVDVLENSENEDLVNLSYLQTLPENENAMFQIASNFNCIESPDASASLGKSNFVTKCKKIIIIIIITTAAKA